MDFDRPERLTEFLMDACSSWETTRVEIARRQAVDMCYYEGLQWLQYGASAYQRGGVMRLFTDYDPDSRRLRVTANMTTAHALKVAAATHPSSLYVDVHPPDAGGGIADSVRARTCEDAINVFIDATDYLNARREANFLRVVTGTWGVGFCARPMSTTVPAGAERVALNGTRLHAYAFDPVRLTLDPGNRNRQLERHEYVIYSEAWTATKIARVLGVALREDDLRTIGELATYENAVARLSDGRIYAGYLRHSRTKGAVVRQVHVSDGYGRFPRMYVGIEPGSGDVHWLNFDNPATPFGGDGLPFGLYHGHQRTDSFTGIGDVAMLRDVQDRRNLLASVIYRHIQRYAGFQIVYDRRTIPRGVTEDEARRMLTNMVGGLVPVDMGSKNDNRIPPTVMQVPPPHPTMLDMLERTKLEMRDQTFRSEANFGVTKSHVPDASLVRLLDEADQVIGIRIREDIMQDERMLRNLLGTITRGVRGYDPWVLATLNNAGFGPDQYNDLIRTPDVDPGVYVKVRESSVRYRSYQAWKSDLVEAVRVGALPPNYLRRAMATEGDSPIIEADRDVSRNIQRSILRIIRGEEWTPVPLGEYSEWFVAECRRALLDPKLDAEARDRLSAAIVSQQRVELESAAQVQAGAGGRSIAAPQPPPQEQARQPETPLTLGELLGQITGEAPVDMQTATASM